MGAPRRVVGKIVRSALDRAGFDVVKRGWPPPPVDCDERTAEIIREVQPFTLTPPDRVMALREALRYIEAAEIPGSIVECGVWRGGSMMAAATSLMDFGSTDRDFYMYDTFTQMPEPGEEDFHVSGFAWKDRFDDPAGEKNPTYRYLPFDEVKAAVRGTGYPPERLHFVQGLIEETIPEHAPDQIALCRLDTDWYSSTAHEMQHLFPRLVAGGVLIVDDYGEFMGAKRAVDEYLAAHVPPVFMHRVDMSCRVIVKPGLEMSGAPGSGDG